LTYTVLISKKARKFLNDLPEKSLRIIKNKIEILYENPFPGTDGDKEKLNLSGYDLYRMHIGRTFTIFYRIFEEEVKILDIMTIEHAHKKYGRL
jgi:mRNA interferase RelE/StbE